MRVECLRGARATQLEGVGFARSLFCRQALKALARQVCSELSVGKIVALSEVPETSLDITKSTSELEARTILNDKSEFGFPLIGQTRI